MRSLDYPKKQITAETFNEKFIYKNAEAWQNIKNFVPLNPLAYNQRLNPCLALQVYDYFTNKFLAYQLRTFLVHPADFDSRYTLSKKVYGHLFKPDDNELLGKPVVLESLYEAALLRLYGINACATLGVKVYRIDKLNENFNDVDFFVIGDNDFSGNLFNKKLNGQPVIFDTRFKDLQDFYVNAPREFQFFIEFLKEITHT